MSSTISASYPALPIVVPTPCEDCGEPGITPESLPPEPSLPPSPDVKNAQAWRETLGLLEGCEEGFSAGPGNAIRTFNVSSALQLPYILAAGQEQGTHVLVNFPTSPTTDTAVAQEQTAIKDFLQTHHGKPLESLKAEIVALIESSFSYQHFKADSMFAENFPSAEAWVEVHIAAVSKDANTLSVTDLITAEAFARCGTGDLLVSLETSVQSGRKTIIALPIEQADLDNAVAKLREVITRNPTLEHAAIAVWTNSASPPTISEYPVRCPEIAEVPLAEFLARYTTNDPHEKTFDLPQPTDEPSPGSNPVDEKKHNENQAPGTDLSAQLDAVENVLADLRSLRTTVQHIESLEQNIDLRQESLNKALADMRPLLAATTEQDSSARTNKRGIKHTRIPEVVLALKHKSSEGREFKTKFYLLKGLRERLSVEQKNMSALLRERRLGDRFTPEGAQKPTVTSALVSAEIKKEVMHAKELRKKLGITHHSETTTSNEKSPHKRGSSPHRHPSSTKGSQRKHHPEKRPDHETRKGFSIEERGADLKRMKEIFTLQNSKNVPSGLSAELLQLKTKYDILDRGKLYEFIRQLKHDQKRAEKQAQPT